MPRIISSAKLMALATFGLFLAACAGGNGSALPTGSSSSSGATIMGTLDSGAASSSSGDVRMASHSAGIKVTVVETGRSTETDASGRFVVSAPPGSVTLRFQGPGVDAQLKIDGLVAGQTLTITVHASGSSADIEDGEDGPHDSCFAAGAKAEVEGRISATASDSITVTQQGKGDFVCLVSAATRIRKGNRSLTLADLVVGGHVHVSGTGRGSVDSACELDAAEIKLQ